MQRNWLAMFRAKEVEAAKQTPMPVQPVTASAAVPAT